MVTGDKGIRLVKHFESLFLVPYLCQASVATHGWGHVIIDPETHRRLEGIVGLEKAKKLYPSITVLQAESYLKEDLKEAEDIVNMRIKVPLLQHQFDALVSHTFNTGGSSTLFKLINTNAPKEAVEEWWTKHYITAKGKKSNGLIRRRCIEYKLYDTNKLTLI
jgi:lysozyme